MADDNHAASTPFFTLAATMPSSTGPGPRSSVQADDAIKTLRKAYRTVFGRNVPARDRDNHLLLWTQICSARLEAHSSRVVEELRQILTSLPDLTWPNVARVVGLDPSLGCEQLSETPIQILFLPDSFILKLLARAKRSGTYRRDNEEYSHLGSIAVKYILLQLGGFLYDNETEGLDALDFELEMRIVHNAVLLVVESKRPASSEVHAQAIAEATCLAASNSRLGYSTPIHIIVTGREETTFYTYDPSAKKFYTRQHFTMEDLQPEEDIGEDPEDIWEWHLQQMTAILARDLFSLIVEGYQDFIQATIHRFRLPLALQPYAVATERLNVCDEHSFMRRLRVIVPSTGAAVEREMHVKTICHALLSFVCFEIEGDADDRSRSIYYYTSNFPGLEFELRVEAITRTESDTPDMTVNLHWRWSNADWQLGGSWSLCFETFFRTNVALPSKFDEIEDTGFLSRTRYAEFRDSVQAELLRPLWDSIRENFPGTETEAFERALALIEEAKPLVSNPVGTQDDREAGMEKLRESVRGLPWESESILRRLEYLKQEAYRFQRSDVMVCNKHPSE